MKSLWLLVPVIFVSVNLPAYGGCGAELEQFLVRKAQIEELVASNPDLVLVAVANIDDDTLVINVSANEWADVSWLMREIAYGQKIGVPEIPYIYEGGVSCYLIPILIELY